MRYRNYEPGYKMPLDERGGQILAATAADRVRFAEKVVKLQILGFHRFRWILFVMVAVGCYLLWWPPKVAYSRVQCRMRGISGKGVHLK